MNQNQIAEQSIQQLQNQIQASQSRSFEMVSQLTAERDQSRGTIKNLEDFINKIVEPLTIEGEPNMFNILKALAKQAELVVSHKALLETMMDKSPNQDDAIEKDTDTDLKLV